MQALATTKPFINLFDSKYTAVRQASVGMQMSYSLHTGFSHIGHSPSLHNTFIDVVDSQWIGIADL